MKKLLRYILINVVSLWATTQIISGFSYTGGFRNLLLGGLVFTIINFLLIPLLKILFLPLNILTLGLFSAVINVLAIYALTTTVSAFQLSPYFFPGVSISGFMLPALDLTPFWVAVVASIIIGIITHFLQWLVH